MASARKPIPSLRWWIGGLLFASTVINYIDRQTLSLLAPYLKLQYHWTNSDYANIAIAFRVAYSIGQTGFGKLMDRIGTRRGLTLTVIWYSMISMLTSLASGLLQLRDVPLFAGRGRIGQLAGRDQGGLGMVSETRAGAGDGAVRQRIFHRRRGRAFHCVVDLFSLGMAAGVHGSGHAGISLADCLAMAVLSAGGAPPDQAS